MSERTQSKRPRVLLSLFALVAALTVGFPVGAAAATFTFWDGPTFQNQTKSSGTAYMNNARTYSFNQVAMNRITVNGVGSASGYLNANMGGFPGRTTNSYCLWFNDYGATDQTNWHIVCQRFN